MAQSFEKQMLRWSKKKKQRYTGRLPKDTGLRRFGQKEP